MWRAEYAPTFLKDLKRLPKAVQERVGRVVFGEETLHDPFLGGKTQKMRGYQTQLQNPHRRLPDRSAARL